MMSVRAKFRLQEHREYSSDGKYFGHTFIFRPMYDPSIPEDQRFAEASPSGELTINVDNPAVVEMWKNNLGYQFYLDFVDVVPE
jgi:hypothetical protein